MAKPSAHTTVPAIRDWHAIAVITAAVGVFFRDILLQKAFLWEDFLYQFYPFRTFAAVSLSNGELPLWNPYTFNGMPFQADIQSALFYIPNILLTLFVSGDRLPSFWLELFIIIHYVVAGVGMYYLAKQYGLENVYALFSGLVFALCGFMVAHAIHQVIINHVAWLPWSILLFRKTLNEYSPLAMMFTGLLLGHAILAGFPQITLYIFFFLLLVFLFEATETARRDGLSRALRLVPLAAGVIVIALALPAVQLLPTLELAPLSQRAEITYEKSLESSLYWEQLVTAYVPNFFGTRGAQGSTFWLTNGYSQYWETCFYLGIASLVFIIFAAPLIRTDRRIVFFFIVAVFSLLYALGDRFILHKFFFHYVPGFGTFRSIGRITLLLSVAGALLAGFGFKHLVTLAQENKSLFRKFLAGIAGFGILFWIAVQMGFLQPSGQPNFQQIHAIATSETTTRTLLLLIACALAYAFSRGLIPLRNLVVGFLLLHFADIHLFGFDQNNGSVKPEEYYQRTARLTSFLKEEGKREFFRVNSRQGNTMLLDRNQGMVDRIFLMEGYTPLALQRVYLPAKNWDRLCDIMNVKYRVAVDEQRQMLSLREADTYLPRAFMVYHSITLTDEDSVRAFMESDRFDPLQTVVFEEEPPLHPDTAVPRDQWSAAITSYRLNEISLRVSTPTEGYLVLSELYYPDWYAYLGDKKQHVLQADWNLRALPVTAGTHTVNVRFEPARFTLGMTITLATLGISAGGIVYFRTKRKRHTNP